MEQVNERRRFVKGVGFFAALFAGGSALNNANTISKVGDAGPVNDNNNPAPITVAEDISLLAPPVDNKTHTLTLMGAYEPKEPTPPGQFTFLSNQKMTHEVSMAVGLDNRLWIKVDDQWKRVALEG